MTETLRNRIIEAWTETPISAQTLAARIGISYFNVSAVLRALPDFEEIKERKKRQRLAEKDRDNRCRRAKKMARLAAAASSESEVTEELSIGKQRAADFIARLNRQLVVVGDP